MCLERSYLQDDLRTQFTSNDHDRNKTNCHASASVKSEIRASNDLIHETICELNLQAMITTMKQQKIDFGRCLNASWSPPHPPSKKASSPDRSLEGL